MHADKQHNLTPWRMHFFCASLIVAALAGGAFQRNSIWQDPVSLGEDNARKSPRIGRVYLGLGLAYHRKHQTAKALENYYKVIKSGSASSLDAYNNIGSMYVDMGEYEKAVQIFSRLLLLDQNNALVYASRGNAYFRQGQYDNAIQDFSESLLLSRYNAEVHLYRGMSYEKKGNRSAAFQDFKTACAWGEARACKKLSADDNEIR